MVNHIGEIILGILGTSLFTLLWKRLDRIDIDLLNVRRDLSTDITNVKQGLSTDIIDLRNQVRHFVDLHINHEGRLATIEERTKQR